MSVSSREVIIKQGDKGDRLYLIARGVVRISREKDGKTTKLTSLFAGDFFGEMALLHDEVRSATVTSITPCTFYVLDRKDVEEVMAQQPSIRLALQRADQHRRDEQQKLDGKQS
ncbi:cyclic nucleotide-binding domain-containing protein [Gammaproteobacteria bacterium]|nr:cyclic nucleotide-binding domain-containing protein [Gammaproteobacteria bacterium]